jgi:heme/copper-type cytochrome/quinol oxidase subunit 3
MSERAPQDVALDVSHLPPMALSTSALLWWGIVGFVVIEGTAFAFLITVALYLRYELAAWPPPHVPPPDLTLPVIGVVLLLASLVPMHRSEKATERGDRAATLLWLGAGTALGLAFVAVRIVIWASLPFDWKDHAYGSIVWTLLGLHTLHLGTELAESLVVGVLLALGYWRDEQRLSVLSTGAYWDFVVLGWIPVFAVLYLLPHWG